MGSICLFKVIVTWTTYEKTMHLLITRTTKKKGGRGGVKDSKQKEKLNEGQKRTELRKKK